MIIVSKQFILSTETKDYLGCSKTIKMVKIYQGGMVKEWLGSSERENIHLISIDDLEEYFNG